MAVPFLFVPGRGLPQSGCAFLFAKNRPPACFFPLRPSQGSNPSKTKKYSTHMKWMLYFMARPEGWPRGGFALRCLSSQHSCFGLRG